MWREEEARKNGKRQADEKEGEEEKKVDEEEKVERGRKRKNRGEVGGENNEAE